MELVVVVVWVEMGAKRLALGRLGLWVLEGIPD